MSTNYVKNDNKNLTINLFLIGNDGSASSVLKDALGGNLSTNEVVPLQIEKENNLLEPEIVVQDDSSVVLEKPRRTRHRYSEEDIKTLLRSDLSIKEAADIIGVTLTAAYAKRYSLRKSGVLAHKNRTS